MSYYSLPGCFLVINVVIKQCKIPVSVQCFHSHWGLDFCILIMRHDLPVITEASR